MENYLALSRAENYNSEQALALLAWHRRDFVAAKSDLGNFTPLPDTWSLLEKEYFAEALQVEL